MKVSPNSVASMVPCMMILGWQQMEAPLICNLRENSLNLYILKWDA